MEVNWIKEMRKCLGKETTIYDEFRWILKHTVRISPKIRMAMSKKIDELQLSKKKEDPTVEDGFGNICSQRCPVCKKLTMEIVRPGKAACSNPNCSNS